MQHAPAQDPRHLEMIQGLREHLLAAGASGTHSSPYPPPPTAESPVGMENPYRNSDSASPHDSQHLEPSSGSGQHMQYSMGDSAGNDGLSPLGLKGKRELSTSKRAAQNRAAQRAFRQRKEGYIKKLEEQVQDLETMESGFRALQNENFQLREYILSLQARLLETSSDIPAPPSHINLHVGAPTAPSMSGSANKSSRHEPQHQDGMSQLRAAAAQASEIRQSESPYGVGVDYAHGRARADEASGSTSDAKPAT